MGMGGSGAESDLDLIARAARMAGTEALARRRTLGAADIRAKDDSSPVTSADLAANSILEETLLGARPDYGWLSEESTDDKARLARECVFVVDPIDGTQAYIDGGDAWVISVAVVRDGASAAGVLYRPATDSLYAAVAGGGAYCNDTKLHVRDWPSLDGGRLVSPERHLTAGKWRTPWPADMATTDPNSMAYRIAMVARGDWHGALALSAKRDWDLAAAGLILTEAGGIITGLDGAPFRYNQMSTRKPGVACGAPLFHAALLRRLGERIGDAAHG